MPAPILWRAAMTPRPAVRFLDESGQPLHDSGSAGPPPGFTRAA